VCCVTARTRPNAQFSAIAASSESVHWRPWSRWGRLSFRNRSVVPGRLHAAVRTGPAVAGATARPPGSSAPPSSNSTTPLHSRLHPCPGWFATILAALRPGARASGHCGRCRHSRSPARRVSPASMVGSRMWPAVSCRGAAGCMVSSSRGQSGLTGTEPAYRNQDQAEVADPVQQPAQGGLVRDRAGDDRPRTRSKACGPRPGQARRGQPHRGRGPGPRTEPHPWSRAVATPAGSLHSHDGQAPTPGQVTPWCPVLPRKIPPGMSPFGGRLARRIFLACGERNAHRKEDAQWPPSSPARPTAAPRSPAPPRPPPADPALYPQPGGLRLRYSFLLSTGS